MNGRCGASTRLPARQGADPRRDRHLHQLCRASASWWRSASSQFADIVGRERVIAGVDCGFGTFAGVGKIDPDIAFKKLGRLVEGAALASKRLWAR